MDLDRDVVRKRNIIIAVLGATLVLLGLAAWTLRPAPRPEVVASVAPAPVAAPEAPTARTTITSADQAPKMERPAPPAPRPTAAPETHKTETPPAPAAPIDPTKIPPGQLNLPGSGMPFTPAPYVPPPPGWEPPPGWTFVPPEQLVMDGGAPPSR